MTKPPTILERALSFMQQYADNEPPPSIAQDRRARQHQFTRSTNGHTRQRPEPEQPVPVIYGSAVMGGTATGRFAHASPPEQAVSVPPEVRGQIDLPGVITQEQAVRAAAMAVSQAAISARELGLGFDALRGALQITTSPQLLDQLRRSADRREMTGQGVPTFMGIPMVTDGTIPEGRVIVRSQTRDVIVSRSREVDLESGRVQYSFRFVNGVTFHRVFDMDQIQDFRDPEMAGRIAEEDAMRAWHSGLNVRPFADFELDDALPPQHVNTRSASIPARPAVEPPTHPTVTLCEVDRNMEHQAFDTYVQFSDGEHMTMRISIHDLGRGGFPTGLSPEQFRAVAADWATQWRSRTNWRRMTETEVRTRFNMQDGLPEQEAKPRQMAVPDSAPGPAHPVRKARVLG